MNAPVLYIIIPLVLGSLLFFIRDRTRITQGIGITFSFIWGLLGFLLPLGEVISAGDSALKISSSLFILGRRLSILDTDRPIIGMIFTFSAIWFLGALLKQESNLYIPVGVVISGLLIASIAIEPFLYAALILALIALLGVLILAERGNKIGSGVLRFLVFQMLGVPFILLTDWVLTVAGVNPSDEMILHQAVLFIVLGFAFWLGIFPFNTWITMLANEGNIIASGFIFSFLPLINLFLLLDYVNTYAWLRESSIFFQAFNICGTVMLITAGIGAVFQKNIKKLIGHAVIIETGLSLIAISLNTKVGYEYIVMSIVPRTLAYLLITFALSKIGSHAPSDQGDIVDGSWTRYPWSAAALLVGLFSLAGIPLLGSFPIKLTLAMELASSHPGSLIVFGMGIAGLFAASVRMSFRTRKKTLTAREPESKTYIVTLICLAAMLAVAGLFPTLFYQNLNRAISSFPYLYQ